MRKILVILAAMMLSSALCITAYAASISAPKITAKNVSSSGKVQITWDSVKNAKEYKVYRATSKDGKYSLLSTVTGTKMTNTSATAGKTYYYYVRAVDAKGNKSAKSNIVSRACDLPRPAITTENNSSGYTVVRWESIDKAQEYQLYRATSKDGSYSKIATVSGTKYTDKSATTNKTYYYKLKAIASKSSANSAYSSVVSGKRLPGKLSTPVVTISRNSDKKPSLTWKAITGATGYEVYRATSSSGTYKLMKTTTGTKYTNTSATNYETYYYKVRAIAEDSSRNSNYSEVKSATAGVEYNDSFKTYYVKAPKVSLYKQTSSSGTKVVLKYMDEVKLGNKVSTSSSGSWRRVLYNKKIYYTWLPSDETRFTTKKPNYAYVNENNSDIQNAVLQYALKYADLPTYYAHSQSTGEINPSNGKYGFDCSGFASHVINYVIQQYNPLYNLSAKLSTLHETGAAEAPNGTLYNYGFANSYKMQTVSRKNLKPGDVIFFKVTTDSKKIDHCGIYLGNQEFIHATTTHDGVCIMPLTGMFDEGYVTARRYMPTNLTPANQTLVANAKTSLYSQFGTQPEDGSTKMYLFYPGETVTLLYSSPKGKWGYVAMDDGRIGYVLMEKFDLAE